MIIGKSVLGKAYCSRPQWCHKGEYGRVLIIGGSSRYPGAPALVALAALRSGADWTVIAAPKEAAKISVTYAPDLMIEPLEGELFSVKSA